jgi:hypothetical protein
MTFVCRLFYVVRLLLRRRELRSRKSVSSRSSEKESKNKRYVNNKTGKVRLEGLDLVLIETARDLQQLKLKRGKLYGTNKNRFVIRIGNNETRLEHRLSNVIRLRSRPKGSSNNHLQKDVLPPLMVYFHLSWKRSISI